MYLCIYVRVCMFHKERIYIYLFHDDDDDNEYDNDDNEYDDEDDDDHRGTEAPSTAVCSGCRVGSRATW